MDISSDPEPHGFPRGHHGHCAGGIARPLLVRWVDRGKRHYGEQKWRLGTALRSGYPHGIAGFADLASKNVQAVIEEHCQYANVRGIRQCLNYHQDPIKTFIDSPHLTSDPQWRKDYGLLKRFGLSFDLQLYYTQMEEALQLAARLPGHAHGAQSHRHACRSCAPRNRGVEKGHENACQRTERLL